MFTFNLVFHKNKYIIEYVTTCVLCWTKFLNRLTVSLESVKRTGKIY